ncbi:autotransporter domain-containing protein [Candidatus Tisiphia endosymbiont of Hybos culiciformis]|uniref:autotransporter outer membrane beta-barrel domain-containing protein n=1 Tax=Candidatus Tisiphia endosymbiont of Hybos culiciformis TaxID=3139331 RepID=UPI003CCAA7AD
MLFNVGLAQLVLISACKTEGSGSPRVKLGESRTSSGILTSSNIVNLNASLYDRELDSENIPPPKANIPPPKGFSKSRSSSGILTSSNIVNLNASLYDRELDSENIPPPKANIPPPKGFSKSRSSSGILTSSNIVNLNASLYDGELDSENIPPPGVSPNKSSYGAYFKSEGGSPPRVKTDKSKSPLRILTVGNTVNEFEPNDTLSQKANVSLPLDSSLSDEELDSENIPPPKDSSVSSPNKSSYGAYFKSEGGSPPRVKTDKSKSPLRILTVGNTVNEFEPNDTLSQKANVSLNLDASLSDEELDSENIPSPKDSSVSSPNKSSYGAYFKSEGGSPPRGKTDKSKSPLRILTVGNTVNEFEPNDTLSQKANVSLPLDASLSDGELDSENIPPPGVSPNKSSYGAYFKSEGGSPPRVKTDKSKSPSKILTNRNTVNEFEPNDTQSQKANVSLPLDSSLYDRELDSENIPPPGVSPNKSSYGAYFKSEDSSPPRVKTDKSKSPLRILTGGNTVNEFEPNDTQPQKANVSLNLDASLYDGELDSENIPPPGVSPNKSSYGAYFKSEGGSPPRVKTDKSKSPSKILTNRNTVNEFEPNDTLSQKTNVSLPLDSSLSDGELDSENIPPPKGVSPNKSSYGAYFKSEDSSLPSAKADKSILQMEVLTNTSTVDKFNLNDTQSQKTNVLSSLNTSLSDGELDSENISPKGSSSLSLKQFSYNSYFAFKTDVDENRSPSLLTQEYTRSTPELSTIVQQKSHKVRYPFQEVNQLLDEHNYTERQSSGLQEISEEVLLLGKKRNSSIEESKLFRERVDKSIEEIKQAGVITRNPSAKVNNSSKENIPGIIAATSSTKVKRWDAISPLSSYQNSGTNLGSSPTTSPAKLATSTPAKVPPNLVLSPSNNSQSDAFRDCRDSRDPILESPIKDVTTSTSNKKNSSSNISRVLSPLFNNNGSKNTDLLSTDNQLQKIKPQEDEEQELILEFNNLSITEPPDLGTSSRGAEPLILPTTSTMPNTHHRNQLKELKQKHKDNEFKQAMKRQEQRKKDETRIEAKITADKKQVLDMVKQMNKEQRQQARAEQNNRAIDRQPIVPKPVVQQPLTPATNRIPDAAFTQNNIEPSIVLDEEGWTKVESKAQRKFRKDIAKLAKLQEKLVVEQNHRIIDQRPIVAQPTAQQLLAPATNKTPDVACTQNNIEPNIVSDGNEGEWKEVVSKKQKRLNKNIAKLAELQKESAVEQNNGAINQQPIVPKQVAQQLLTPETNKISDATFVQNNTGSSIVPVQGEQQEMVRKKRKKRNKRNTEKQVNAQPEQVVVQKKENSNQNLESEKKEAIEVQKKENSNQNLESEKKEAIEVQKKENSNQNLESEKKEAIEVQKKENSNQNLESEEKEAIGVQKKENSNQNLESEEKEAIEVQKKEDSSSKSETPSSPVLQSNIPADNDTASRNNNDELILQEQVKALEQQTVEVQKQVTSATINSVVSVFDFIEQSVQSRFHQFDLAVLGSGDEDNVMSKNVWISGTIGTAKYNGYNVLSRYTGRTRAATIGGDIELQGGSIIGGAYNYVLSNFKYKNRTDKVAAHAHVISIYGQTNLSDKLILQGVLSFAFGNVSAKIPVQKQLAKAKFANTSYSSKVVVAHKSQVGKVLITPNIGLKYGGYNIAGYNESFEAQSLSVAATNDRRASGIIGFEAVIPMKINDTTQVIPGLHIEGERFLHNKQQKVRMQITSGSNRREEVLLLEKPAKYNYKIGGTITLKRGATEIMAVYDYLASNNKYSSHQGSVKLRVSF